MRIAPTPRDVLFQDGTARLYRFRRPGSSGSRPAEGGRTGGLPLLLVPSMINRWYVLDLREGASLVAAMVEGGLDTYCLDWGIPEDEDRYLEWDDVIDRLARFVRRVKRETGAPRVGILGYCMGATLSGIYTAIHPEEVAAFANLAGPFDFSQAGALGELTDPRWFDVEAVAAAGNVSPLQMQSGFLALRPTAQLAKWIGFLEKLPDEEAREAFRALEHWASDNIPFPAAAYATYVRELYQQNLLIRGEHHVRGRRVSLGRIRCPVLTIVAQKDAICPPDAATALNRLCGASDNEVLEAPGGHVGAVVGARAKEVLYPAIVSWFRRRLCS